MSRYWIFLHSVALDESRIDPDMERFCDYDIKVSLNIHYDLINFHRRLKVLRLMATQHGIKVQ